VGIWQVKIQDLVAEGSLVEAGDYVAALDQTEISGKIKDTGAELEKAESQFLQAKLDTTLTLRAARDEILNMAFNLTQKELTLEQSRFEPPAIIRQAELELEKIKRDMVQIQENYKVKKQQAEAKMAEAGANLQQIRNKMDNLQRVFGEFTIRAPKSGMVIYMREWNGQKKKVGSTISPWDPAVATLPDLRYMLSKTYVNEVDIRKLAINQPVSIGLDAFPDLKLKGKVNQVANVGEQKGNTDSKVFEVVIEVLDTDTNVRPGMTTSNRILTATVKDTLVIPLEAVFNQDSISFVYRKSGLSIEKQEIRLGSANENEVIVVDGVKEGDKLLLTEPKTMLDKPITRLTTSSNQAIAKAKP
jgi:RND family efflux transporter MFP subunit